MVIMKYAGSILIAIAVIGAIFLFSKTKETPYTLPPVPVLPSTDWIMSGMVEKDSTVEKSLLTFGFTLSFDTESGLSGKICNSFGGKYEENGPSFKSQSLQSTEMFCEGISGEVETYFFNALDSGVTYAIDDGILVITDTFTGRKFFFTK